MAAYRRSLLTYGTRVAGNGSPLPADTEILFNAPPRAALIASSAVEMAELDAVIAAICPKHVRGSRPGLANGASSAQAKHH
jgi:hypothetical protein